MSNSKEDKAFFKMMEAIDEINPYTCFLDKSKWSRIDEYIDTGSMSLNAIMSGSVYKGIPVGRIVQLAGASMTGKTFFVQNIIRNAQKMGKHVVVFDSENAIDPDGAKAMGIDTSRVKYVCTTTVENTRNAIKNYLKKVAEAGPDAMGKVLIVIDSIAQLESELGEKRMSENNNAADMGNFAKSIKALMKTCINWGKITKTTFVFTNEIYDNPTQLFPSIEKDMPGGRAAIYKPTITVQLARIPTKDDDGKTIDNTLAVGQKKFGGIVLRGLTVKNRLIKQYLEANMYLSFAKGLNKYYGLLELLRGFEVVKLEGQLYFDYNGNKLGRYSSWRKDDAVWDTLLPKLDECMAAAWPYSSVDDEEDEDTLDDDDDDDDLDVDDDDVLDCEEPLEISPLDKLKNLKKKVSDKIDYLDQDEVVETE